MERTKLKAVYFVGAGGIGMSSLIRYFLSKNISVAGYDRVSTELTERLNTEGAAIHYKDDVLLIPDLFRDVKHTLVVYTPALPVDHQELAYFRSHHFEVIKRAEVLGQIINPMKSLCVSGTHGKTTTSSMLAHILKQSTVDCMAFLGGILKGYESNLMLSAKSDYVVAEADEFDRSFHRLTPYMAVITAVDPDHLDIYGTPEAYRKSFSYFTSLIKPGGCLLLHKGLDLDLQLEPTVTLYTYSGTTTADFYANNIRIGNGEIFFDFFTPFGNVADISLGVPVRINIENAVAALALASMCGVTPEEMREGMASFKGARRRFDFRIKRDDFVLIDDYAHHPKEVSASVNSVRELYPGRKLTAVFQPHLYSRTKDFYEEFAKSLSQVDDLILLDIYPAREAPIRGVTSKLIYDATRLKKKTICTKDKLIDLLKKSNPDVLLMIGAGDISDMVEPVEKAFS